MDVQIELKYGPLHVEVESQGEEEYDEVLENVAEFIDENEDLFGNASTEISAEEPDNQPEQEETDLSQFTDSGQTETSSSNNDENTLSWHRVSSESGVSEDKLRYMFGVDEGVLPQILFGDKLTDESNTEQMLRGTLMILCIWEDYYGNKSLIKEEITDTLRKSGIHHKDYYNVYQRSEFSTYFIRDEVSREGVGGETSEISLTPPGKSKAYEFIEEYADGVDV